jgi:hypothetical protein
MAARQHRRGEVIEVVDGADAAIDRVGADAVLRMDDVVIVGRECRTQGLDRAHDPLSDRFGVVGRERHHLEVHRGVDRSEETTIAPSTQRPHRHLGPGRGECLRQVERVHHSAARFRGVGEQRDAHQSPPFSSNRFR